jgi:hypothetical protein
MILDTTIFWIVFALSSFILANKRVYQSGGSQQMSAKRPKKNSKSPSSSSGSNSEWPPVPNSSGRNLDSEIPSSLVPIPSFTSINTYVQVPKPLNFDTVHPVTVYEAPATAKSESTSSSALWQINHTAPIARYSISDYQHFDTNSEKREVETASTDLEAAIIQFAPVVHHNASSSNHTAPSSASSSSFSSAPPPSTDRSAYLAKLNMLTFEGKDIAAVLTSRENFFVDLPYIDCVLPSMKAGEQYFVPIFIHKVLLPSWYEKRGEKFDAWFDDEQIIIGLSKEYYSAAMTKYSQLLAYVSLLEIGYPLDENAVRNSKFPLLSRFLNEYVGVNIEAFVTISPKISKALDIYLCQCISGIPAIIMLGLQWGFNVEMIILNLALFSKRVRTSIGRHIHGKLVDFLKLFKKKTVLPTLYPSTVASVHWAISPVFEFKPDESGVLRIIPIQRLVPRKAYIPVATYDRCKYYEIKQILIARKYNIEDHRTIFLPPKAIYVYEEEGQSRTSEPTPYISQPDSWDDLFGDDDDDDGALDPSLFDY